MVRRYRDAVLALGAVGAVALLCWLALGGRVAPPASPLGYAPGDSAVVLHARLEPLRSSALVQHLAPELAGSPELERLCGFDPVAQVREAIVFLGQGDDEGFGPLGLVVRGTFDREALPDCLERIMREDGSAAKLTRLDGAPALASAEGGSRAVFVGADAVAVGAEQAARGVLRATRGEIPSATADPTLAHLWERVGGGREITLAAKLPERFRQLVPAAAAEYLGVRVDEVSAAAAGLNLSRGLDLGLVAQMAGPEQAERSVRALQDQIAKLRTKPIVAFSVLGKLLRRLHLAADGRELVATLSVPEDDIRSLLELIDRRGTGAGAAAPSADPARDPEPTPDQVLERPDPAGP
jgi:hypothetical protein